MKIRKAEEEDMIFLFNLRNEIAVRQSAFNTKPVDLETHNNGSIEKWLIMTVLY